MGKILGHWNKKSLAAMVLHPSNKELQSQVIKRIGKMCVQEIKYLCSGNYDSLLHTNP